MSSMLNRMTAELIIDDPNNLGEVTARFIDEGFDVEFLDDWIDDGGKVVWILVDIVTDEDPDEFLSWVGGIVDPLGDVVAGGPCTPEQRIAWRKKDLD